MRRFLRYCIEEKPLLFCIWSGFFLRIVAVLFAQGIAFGYDHYIYVETAQQIASGSINAQQICLNHNGDFVQHGHSLIFLYINAAILWVCEALSIFDTKSKMYIMRLSLGMISLLTVYYSYRITYRLGNRRAAFAIGIIASMLWFMPYISVKNLPENIASIFVLAAIYRLVKTRRRTYKIADDIFTGFLLGISVSFCYYLTFFIIGTAIAFVLKSKYKRALLIIFGASTAILLTEGLLNTILLGSPFYIISEYIDTIIAGAHSVKGFRSVYMYISILILMIPLPWGIFAIVGYIKSWKHTFILFVPTTIYLLASYLLPNKEEKYMLAILPLFLIICASGWYVHKGTARFWTSHPKISNWSVYLFLIVNTPMLALTTIAYTRKPQIETMQYLSHYRTDISSILVEDSGHHTSKGLPMFYLGKNVMIYWLNAQSAPPDRSIYYSCIADGPHSRRLYTEHYFHNPAIQPPQYVIFYGDYNIDERIQRITNIFPGLAHVATISPSLADRVIQSINPTNSTMRLHIYSIQ